jgi:hypothetical protein
MTIAAKSRQQISFSADTVGNPATFLMSGEKLYFALRADWDNPNITVGCRVFFVESFGTRAMNGTNIGLVPNVLSAIPADVQRGLSIAPCQRT